MESPKKPSCTVDLFFKIDPVEKGTYTPTDEKRAYISGLSESVKSIVDGITFRLFLRKYDDRIDILNFLEISKPDFSGAIVFEVTGLGVTHNREWNFYRVTTDDPFIWEFSSNVSKTFIGLVNREYGFNVEVTLKVAIFVRQMTGNTFAEQLMTDESLSDITIKVGDMEIKTQKCVLAMHSEYFKRAFKLQKGTDPFVVEDFSYQSVKAMVNFLYANVDEKVLSKNAEELLAVANKYEIQPLKDFVSGILESDVAQSPVRIAELAHRCNAPRLLQVCVKYVEANFEEVKKSDEWGTLAERNPNVLCILTEQKAEAIEKLMAKLITTKYSDD